VAKIVRGRITNRGRAGRAGAWEGVEEGERNQEDTKVTGKRVNACLRHLSPKWRNEKGGGLEKSF